MLGRTPARAARLMTAAKGGSSPAAEKRVSSALRSPDVRTRKRKTGQTQEPTQPPILQTNVVGIVEIVDTDDFVSLREQKLGDFRADEPGGSRDEVSTHSCARPPGV